MSANEDQIARIQQIERIQQMERIKALEAAQAGNEEAPPAAPVQSESMLQKGLNVLDWQRAHIGEPALAKALSKLTGKPVKSTGKGSADLLNQAGVFSSSKEPPPEQGAIPTGFSPFNMAKSALAEVGHKFVNDHPDAARNILGIGLDVGTDPMTYESMGASALAKLKNLGRLEPAARALNMTLNPMEEFMKWRQGANYRNAFSKLDDAAARMDKSIAPSKMLQDAGFVGDHSAAADVLEDINKNSGQSIGNLLDEASKKGASVHPVELWQKVKPEVERLRGLGLDKSNKLADEIQHQVTQLWMAHPEGVPVNKANEIKTFLDHQIKASGFAAGNEAPLMSQAEQEVSNAIRNRAPEATAKVDKPLSQKLSNAMKKFASSDKNVVDRARQLGGTAKELNGPFGLTAVDMALMGGAGGNAFLNDGDLSSDPFLGMLLMKKLGQAAMSTPGRTLRGKVAGQIATHGAGLVDPLIRQAPRTVWGAMQGNDQ